MTNYGNHSYYLVGTKKATDDYIKELFAKKRRLEEENNQNNEYIKSLKEDGCILKPSNFFIIRKKQLKNDIADVEKEIEKKIIETRLIKRVLFYEIGHWYKSYKRR